jgi:hypothetical protein
LAAGALGHIHPFDLSSAWFQDADSTAGDEAITDPNTEKPSGRRLEAVRGYRLASPSSFDAGIAFPHLVAEGHEKALDLGRTHGNFFDPLPLGR